MEAYHHWIKAETGYDIYIERVTATSKMLYHTRQFGLATYAAGPSVKRQFSGHV